MKNFLALGCAVLLGCATPRAVLQPPPPQDRATAYYPLKVGNRWTYDEVSMGKVHNTWQSTVASQGSPTQFVMEVAPVTAQSSAQRRPARHTLEVRPRGIFDGVRYVLEDPVSQGKKWMSILDVKTAEKFEVVSTHASAAVPAGRFVDCALITNTIAEPGEVSQVTQVTFCRDVGMVENLIRILKPGKKEIVVSHLRLLSFESGGARVLPRTLGN